MKPSVLTGLVAAGTIAATAWWLMPQAPDKPAPEKPAAEKPAAEDPMAHATIKGPFDDFLSGRQIAPPAAETVASHFTLPPGFRIGLFAQGVPHARGMTVTPTGDLLVASMREGQVILLHRDENGDGRADGRTVLLSGLNFVHSMALRDGYIYVAEMDRIRRAPFDPEKRTAGALETVIDGFPTGGHHRTRTIAFGPDGWLYVTLGSSCNACMDDHPWRATMLRMRPDGSEVSVYATGLRNTVGYDWQPSTGKLYGADNGRDLLGDDTPNCELNLIEPGKFYGWPYAYDDKVPDPEMGKGHEAEIAASVGPVHGFGAHRAPLGMHFLRPGLEPKGYEGDALVAEHGSWNRSTLAGYKVVALHFAADGTITEQDFLTGFNHGDTVIGRPVDVVQGPDGAIYVSDDYAGVVYRVGWGSIVTSNQAMAEKVVTDPLAGLAPEEITRLAAAGEALFKANGCSGCHVPGMASEGVQVKELKGLAARYDIAGIEALLKAPPGPMPVFDLSDDDRKALAAYLLTAHK